MRLPAHLRQSFQDAYQASFGEELEAEEADELGVWLAELAATVALIRADHIHRSGDRRG